MSAETHLKAPALSTSPLIYSKMVSLMREIGPVSKDQKNVAQGFKFRGIDQFVNALHPALAKHQVFMAPKCVSVSHEMREVTRRDGKVGVDKHVHMMMEYTFYAEDGSFVVIGPIPSEGLDSGDKATTKGLSAALKYALIQTFSIPTEDMSEGDYDSPEISSHESYTPKQLESTGVRDELNRKMMALYKPYMTKFPGAVIPEILLSRYGKKEVREIPVEQLRDFVAFLEAGFNSVPAQISQTKIVHAQTKTVERKPTEAQLKRLFAICHQYNVSDAEIKTYILGRYKKSSRQDLSLSEYNELCDGITAKTITFNQDQGATQGSQESSLNSNVVAKEDLPWHEDEQQLL